MSERRTIIQETVSTLQSLARRHGTETSGFVRAAMPLLADFAARMAAAPADPPNAPAPQAPQSDPLTAAVEPPAPEPQPEGEAQPAGAAAAQAPEPEPEPEAPAAPEPAADTVEAGAAP